MVWPLSKKKIAAFVEKVKKIVIVNRQEIYPSAVALGQMTYPQEVEKTFKKHFKDNVHIINGQAIAKKLGNVQAANVVLVGAFSNFFPDMKEERPFLDSSA